MSTVKRVDPRRPYRLSPSGLRRIVLGEKAENGQPIGAFARTNEKSRPLRTQEPAKRWHMAIAHSNRGRLDDHARDAIAAAAILATPGTGVVAVILGEVHEDLAALGADKVIVLPDLDAAKFQPHREEAVISALLNAYQPVHVFMPDNMSGDGDLGRRLIAKHESPHAATNVVELTPRHAAIRWSGGSALADAPLPRFVLLAPGGVDTELPFVGAGEEVPPPQVPDVREVFRDLGLEQTGTSELALEEADIIVAAGNGVRNVETIGALAAVLGAAVGASRVAVDEGKFPRNKQIGASGKTVSATTYFAIGISGAVQHLQGIKSCRHVIAINRDPGAAIVKRADLTVIGDAEELMQALMTRISQARNQAEVSGAEG
ncbi:electron transfer flavoprotein subunit alpha/FixB family protein [Hyphomicrobium sp.]|uniref:electron transfer flavoprotein subunit alpha/FixB family protein n=1 Tax=Hyphomicrobium sp. TaxID=82 RepID=UPI002D788DFD|nr:electron transfer flavoprotein subunit alpha/FixB family protein [Hyphomicrobium sp.]HET6390732.1 electron transfer flavoprotein subunit alpha/FixB family protein [Hyphomicrobium sp.]